MKTLSPVCWPLIQGGHSSQACNSLPLRVYIKRDALYGALGIGLLLSPGSWSMGLLGSVLGATIGAGFGYIEWTFRHRVCQ